MAREYGVPVAIDMQRRLEVSNRLKAARQLAGYLGETGKPTPLPVDALIQLPELTENGITKNRIEDIEQLQVDARPMELQLIARALSLPDHWFARGGGEPLNRPIADLLQAVESDARARRRGGEVEPEESAGEDRPPATGGGDVG